MKWRWGQLGLMWLVVGMVYAGVVENGLVWDDIAILEENPYLDSWSYVPRYFQGGNFIEGGAEKFGGAYYKPVLSLWLMVNYWWWDGVDASGFHVTQLGLHIVNVGLVYWVTRKVVSDALLRSRDLMLQETSNKKQVASYEIQEDKNVWVAFWVALVWGVHPMNVESVAYISAAQEPLYAFFCLLSLMVIMSRGQLYWLVDRMTNSELRMTAKRVEWLVVWVASGLWLLGLLSKESAVVLPVIVAAYVGLVLGDKKLLHKYVVGSVVTFGIYLYLRLGVAGIGFFEEHPAVPIINASLGQRLMTVPYVLVSYLRVLVWPKDLFVSNYRVIKEFGMEVVVWMGGVGLVVGLLVKVMGKRVGRKKMGLAEVMKVGELARKNKLGGVMVWLVIWMVVGFGLVSNVVALDMTFAERWMYFPSIGLLMLLGILVLSIPGYKQEYSRITNNELRITLFLVVLVVFVGGLGWRTYERVGNWRDGLTLYSHDWEVNQRHGADGYDLVANLGLEMEKAGETERARELYEKSVEINPNWWVAYNNLGAYYHSLPDYERAREYYKLSIEKGNYYLAWENLAVVEAITRSEDLKMVVEEGLGHYPKNERLLEVKAYVEELEGVR